MSAMRRNALLAFVVGLVGPCSTMISTAAEEPHALRRLAEARLDAARRAYKEASDLYREGRSRDVDRVYLWSQRWLEAEREVSDKKPNQVLAFEAHWRRMKYLEDLIRGRLKAGAAAAVELPAVEYYRFDAEIALSRVKAK